MSDYITSLHITSHHIAFFRKSHDAFLQFKKLEFELIFFSLSRIHTFGELIFFFWALQLRQCSSDGVSDDGVSDDRVTVMAVVTSHGD
jgi:hypothetical protein